MINLIIILHTPRQLAKMSNVADQRFKNVYERTAQEDPEYYHEAELLNAIWSPPYFSANWPHMFNTQYILSEKMAEFMGTKQASRIECTNVVNKYIKDNNLQSTTICREIIPDETLTQLLGPFNNIQLSYHDLPSYFNKHFGVRAKPTGPDYAPDAQLCDFITQTALPALNAFYQDEEADDYRWDALDFKNKTPVVEELATRDAVAPTVVLDYINNKKLRKVVVTVAYDKPLYDMLGLTEADTLTYDQLADLLRVKMYPELATKATEEESSP